MFSFSGIDVNGSKRLSPTPSVSNLSLRLCRYLSTVTQSSNQGSEDGFRQEMLHRLATFDSLSVQRRLKAKSRMESRTIVCYLGGIWRRLEPLERIYGRFPSVDPSGSLRTADSFPVVASLPPKNFLRMERSDDRKCVCGSQAIRRAASLQSPTFVNLYIERKPFTVQPIKRP